MGIAEKVKARQAKTYAKEDAVAPPDESCMAKIWRYFEVLLVRASFVMDLRRGGLAQNCKLASTSRASPTGSWP